MTKSGQNREKYPQVLVSTIPSWSQRSGANTFATLFQDYPSDRLANIYVKADLPDSKVCSRYFRILEGNVLKSILHPSTITGSEVKSVDVIGPDDEIKTEHMRYAFFLQHRWTIFLWIRELGWKIGKWRSKELDEFLESVNPEIFVYHMQDYWYFNRLNEYIIRKTNPRKTVVYLWDDCFTYKQTPYNLLARLNRYIARKQVKRLISMSDVVLAINPTMKEEADKEFNIDSAVITKPILTSYFSSYHFDSTRPIRIVYSGSLIIGRDRSIAILVECLKEINKNGVKVALDIYSGTALSKKQMARLNVPGISNVRGHLPQNQVFKEQEKADVLLFVEDLNNQKNNVARLSFSTKITDYLSRNRAILAIAPKDIAPTKYLMEQDAAFVCSNKTEIMNTLKNIVENPETLEEYASKARTCGENNHSKSKILSLFTSIICGRNE